MIVVGIGIGIIISRIVIGIAIVVSGSIISIVREFKTEAIHKRECARHTLLSSNGVGMFPSPRQLLDISDQNELKNNPVQRADIKAAEDIYGSNLVGALKG
jgi:hypothetical protein